MITDTTRLREEDTVGEFLAVAGNLETPAFVYDEQAIIERCEYLRQLTDDAGCNLLFTLKPLTLVGVLETIAPYVDGFSTSSLFEATLARSIIRKEGTVHVTTPGLKPSEVGRLGELCDYISFNSVSQWRRHGEEFGGQVKCGLRINPHQSFVKDARYDPCRKHSKLGVPIEDLVKAVGSVPLNGNGLNGLHIHTNCESSDTRELQRTVRRLNRQLGDLLPNFEWINLGGGYLLEDDSSNREQFIESVAILRSRYGLNVFVEPGAAFVREAGYLVATVLDMFDSDAESIAVLDTSVNHMPEVFEYQFLPDILGSVDKGRFNYLLAGSTCLAGDIFGEYSFTEPLEVGSKVVFTDAGAYTLVKAHTFNGLNYPLIYTITAHGELSLKKRFTFEEFASRWGM